MWEYWIQMWIFLCVNQIHRWHFLKGSASLSLLCQGAAQLNYVHSLTTNWLIKPLRTFVLFFTLSFLHFFYAFLTCIVTSAKIATRMAAVCVCLYNEWHSKDELMNLGQKKKEKKKTNIYRSRWKIWAGRSATNTWAESPTASGLKDFHTGDSYQFIIRSCSLNWWIKNYSTQINTPDSKKCS